MDTIDQIRAFLAVVDAGSFAGGARRLDLSPQLVSKYVARLEERLGARLLQRSTRRLSLTEAGRAYSDRSRQLLADFDELENTVGDLTARPHGRLRINAPMSFGVAHLPRAIAAYQAREPAVEIELALNDRIVDIVGEGYDLAIRIARLDDSTLVSRRLATVRLALCAAPAYLSARGEPRTPAELEKHDCLVYDYAPDRRRWRMTRGDETSQVTIRGRFSANNGDALLHAALAGAGIVLQPTFIVGDALREGRLVPVLPAWNVEPLSLYAMYAHRQYLSAKVRSFVDHLADCYGSPPYWDAGLVSPARDP